MKFKFRTRFSAIGDKVDPGVLFPGDDAPAEVLKRERRVKSEFKDECDINLIMARYRKTGILPESARSAAARYGDFGQVPDFMQMQEKLIAANALFDSLPAAVRKQFNNDPGEFISASNTREGRELMVKLGLGKEAVSSPLEASSSSGGGQPPKTSPKADREPNEAPKASKKEASDAKEG